MNSLLLLLISALTQPPAHTAKAEIVEAAIYAWSSQQSSVSVSSQSTNPLVFSGGSEVATLQLGTRVPLVRKLTFGFKFHIPQLKGQYRMLWQVEHPPMTTPDGRVSTGYQEERDVFVDPRYFDMKVYQFDHPYEMVEGRWVFRYIYQGRIVLEQAFTTYQPTAEEERVWRKKLLDAYKAAEAADAQQ